MRSAKGLTPRPSATPSDPMRPAGFGGGFEHTIAGLCPNTLVHSHLFAHLPAFIKRDQHHRSR